MKEKCCTLLTGELPEWQLTNEQRRCFGIAPVQVDWVCVNLPRSKYDSYDTTIWLEGDRVRYIVRHGDTQHIEHALDELLTPDHLYIVPKRSTKPIRLSAATICKRSPVGMSLCYVRFKSDGHGSVSVYNAANMNYYSSVMAGDRIGDMADFRRWCDWWCENTKEADLAEAAAFAALKTRKVALKEGDVFRFRWTRGKWGYGRILLDYRLMRKQKIPFFDCLMGPPLAIEVFMIVTDTPALTVDEVLSHDAMPAQNIMDNVLHFGEFEIIGHAPVPDDRDTRCPIMYGRSLDVRENRLMYQQGRIFRELPGGKPLGGADFRNHGIGWGLDVTMPEVLACMAQGPACYWAQDKVSRRMNLQNPAHTELLKAVRKQMNV